jgi:putative phosphoesterase
MRIAVLGDIHGNIDALTAAYDAVMARKPDRIFHLGDLGGYAPYVNEVVEFLVQHGIEGVQGNYDEAVANDREHCGCRAEEPLQEEMAHRSFTWTKAHVSPESKTYMKNLPPEITITAEGRLVWFFHATPKKNTLSWFAERPEKFFREMAEKGDADVMIYGHIHRPYRKDIEGKVFINAGSVGKPKDGDLRACAAIVEITRAEVRTEFIRVPYDVEKDAEAISRSGLPEYFAEKLRTGA